MIPGAFLVDTFPILRHVPDWLPGAGFKQFAKVGRELFDVAIDGPLDHVKENLKVNGTNVSVAASCFDRVVELADQGFDESVIRSMTATTHIAAVDTVYAVLQTFFLAVALHPHVVKKAQEELDRIVGCERLPQLSDQEDLPYISALITAPVGLPGSDWNPETCHGGSTDRDGAQRNPGPPLGPRTEWPSPASLAQLPLTSCSGSKSVRGAPEGHRPNHGFLWVRDETFAGPLVA